MENTESTVAKAPEPQSAPIVQPTQPAATSQVRTVAPKKSNALKIVLIVLGILLVCCVVTIVAGWALVPQEIKNILSINGPSGQLLQQGTPTATVTPTPTVTLTPTVTEAPSGEAWLTKDRTVTATLPQLLSTAAMFKVNEDMSTISTTTEQNNVIYLGTLQGQSVLYMKMYNGNDPLKFLVKLLPGAFNSMEETTLSLKDITKPVAVLAGRAKDNLLVSGAAFNADKSKLYMAVTSDISAQSDYSDILCDIVEYTVATKSTRLIMEKVATASDVWADRFGNYALDTVLGSKYLIISEANCWACGPTAQSTFVLNVATSKMAYVGDFVTDFKLDASGTSMTVGQLTETGTIPDCMADDCAQREVTTTFTMKLP